MAHRENNDPNKPQRSLRKRKEIIYKDLELSLDSDSDRGLDDNDVSSEEEQEYIPEMDRKKTNKAVQRVKTVFKNFKSNDEEEESISEYEKQRLKNIEENRNMLKQLGLLQENTENIEIVPKKDKIKRDKIRKKPIGVTPLVQKRSLRLQGKTPTGEVFTPTVNDTPKENISSFKRRKVDGELSMVEDGACVDMLDKLKTCFSSSKTTKHSGPSINIDRLIDDMRGLSVAAIQTKVVNKRIQSICVHPIESKLLVLAGSVDGSLGLWDVGSDHGLAEYEPHVSPVNCISVSSTDHSKLFSTSHDGTVRRADINKRVFDLVYHTDEKSKISHITWHCELDENTLLVAHGSGVVGMVDLRIDHEHSLTQSFICHARSVRTVQLHPVQPQYFLTSSGTGEAKIFDVRQKRKSAEHICNLIHKNNKGGYGLTSAFFSPDGNKVLSTCNDDRIRIFDVAKLDNPTEINRIIHDNHTGRWLSVFKAKWHPISSDIFLVGSMQYPKRIQIYNGNGELMREIKSEDMTTICPVLDMHSTQSIVAGGDSVGRVYIFTTKTHTDRLKLYS